MELAEVDRVAPPADLLRADLNEALALLAAVEAVAYPLVPVLVIDDDVRLSELTARGLRRFGYQADARTSPRRLRPDEVVVLDLGVVGSLSAPELAELKASRPIVVTGAADPASRALAADLDASEYLLKPVEMDDLTAAISRRIASRDQSAAK
ncbi:MAG TPA: hypothetical protein VGK85_06205 [Myxococcaceae bacterium]